LSLRAINRDQKFDCRQHIRASTFRELCGAKAGMLRPDWLTLLRGVWAMFLIV
jgi:hypothetical protein